MEEENVNTTVETTEEVNQESSFPSETTVSNSESSIPDSISSDSVFEPTNTENNNKKSSPVVPIVIVVVLLLLIGGGVYYFLSNTKDGKKVMETAINDTFNMALNNMREFEKTPFSIGKDDTLELEGTLTFSTNYPGFEEFKDYSYNLKFAYDQKQKEASFIIGMDKNSATVIDLQAYVKEKRAYLKSPKLFDGIFYTDADLDELELDNLEFATTEDYILIIDNIKSSVVNALDENKISVEDVTRKVDGSDGTYQKTSYTFDSEAQKRVIHSVLNGFLTDDDVLKTISKLTGDDIDIIKEDIGRMQSELTEYDGETVIFNIFTNRAGKFVGLDILDEDNHVIVEVIKDKDNYKLTIKNAFETTVIEATITPSTGTVEGVIHPDTGGADVDFKISSKDNKSTIEITTEYEGANVKINVEINNINEKNKLEDDIKVELSADVEGEKITAEIKLNAKLKNDGKVESFDIANARDINSMTEIESAQISERFNSALEETIFGRIYNQMKSNIVTSTYCAQAFDCVNDGTGEATCKYCQDASCSEIGIVTCRVIDYVD